MSDLKSIINKLRHVVRSENEQLRRGIFTALQDTVSVKQVLLTELDSLVGAYNRFGKTVYIQDIPGLKTKLV